MSYDDVLKQPDKLPEQFVSWLRRFIMDNSMIGTFQSGGGGSASGALSARVILDSPDSGGYAVPGLSTANGFSNVRRLVPLLLDAGTGYWTGSIRIPDDYSSAGSIIFSCVVNTNAGNLRTQVSSSVDAVGVSEDTALTAETAVTTTVPATAKKRFDITQVLTTVPVAGSTLNVKFSRIGADAADTCAATLGIWHVYFKYTGTI